MNAVRQLRKFFWDSPTYGRDRANLISGSTIGVAALLLNGAVLALMSPLLFSPDYHVFQRLTDNLGFGQLLALILLGGASAFATLLIPLRLATVFFEPRVGRYFDQIVLSGISPLRFVIGKATSQNLFLGLILFLLLPYFLFSLTLGGVNLGFFVAGLFLVWLYCLSLALATLWASLYVNELLAALLVIGAATTMCLLGCMPLGIQPYVLSPFPVLLHPVYAAVPGTRGMVSPDFQLLFASCALGMSAFIGGALLAIFLGPLYGIIRENSMFGEVVRAGDSKKKRWFRFRLHIQRSSEIAFFYENRGDRLRKNEGLIRWGIGLGGMLCLSAGSYLLLALMLQKNLVNYGRPQTYWLATSFHSAVLTVNALGLALAALLFSHAKNTTYLRLPLFRGIAVEASRLDTAAFLLFLAFSMAGSIMTPRWFEHYSAQPAGLTVFPLPADVTINAVRVHDFSRVAVEGNAIILLAALAIYALHRQACLGMWMKTAAFTAVGGLYTVLVGCLPILFGVITLEILDSRHRIPWLETCAPTVAAISPGMAMVILFDGRPGQPFPDDLSIIPFYVFHGLLLIGTLWRIRITGRQVRALYLPETARRQVDG